MRKFDLYDRVEAYSGTGKLPPGGYVIGITGAREKRETWGDVLEITFDIAEGEYEGYFLKQYRASQFDDKKYKGVHRLNVPMGADPEKDEATARRFKTDMAAIESSNPGYAWGWDEASLVGKKCGAVFYEKEYEFKGKSGFFTALYRLMDAEAIRSGDFAVPEPKLLESKVGLPPLPVPTPLQNEPQYEEEEIDDGELPF